MKAGIFLGAALACLVSASAATLPQTPDESQPQSLTFMTPRDWRRSSPGQKIALAADFMRIFCVRPAMAPARLADCLDREERGETPFDGAMACVKTLTEAED
jgi:hypothetical protein